MRTMPQRSRSSVHSTGSGRVVAIALLAVLAGCASGPRPGGLPSIGRDGPEANPPANLAQVPDAEPTLEPIRSGGANKPYTVWGQNYVPLTQDAPFRERGLASWYGRKFNGRPTASGELYNMYAMTAAHPTLPIPSYARIRNPANGKEVVVRINDRGPFHSNRIVDLSYTAALKLDLLRGVAPVELERITAEDIRTGAWRRDGAGAAVLTAGRAVTPADAAAGGAAAVVRVAASDVTAVSTAIAAQDAGSNANPAATAANPGATANANPNPAPAAVATAGPGSGTMDATGAVTNPSANPRTNPTTNPTKNAAYGMAVGADGAAAASPLAAAPATTDAPMRAFTGPARGYWVQLGAFRQREGAVGFQKQVEAQAEWITPLLAVFGEASMFRVQAGPYATREGARDAAERVRAALQLVPVIVERR